MGPEDLDAILTRLPKQLIRDPRVLVGNESHDDAGVFQLNQDTALVQTVDFFTPVVDDPYLFGKIAAVNSLSDVYAMGGTPLTALNLLATPADTLSPEIVAEMLQGGQDAMREAGTAIIGGHSIDDPEPKMGYAVTGIIHPDHIWRNDTARVGERLFLTKPIGTGVVVKAIKDGRASDDIIAAAIEMMSTSNRLAKEAIAAVGDPGACTDVTGFGLLGHVLEMALGSHVRIHLSVDEVPILPGALDMARADAFPQGSRRNWSYVEPHVLLRNRAKGPLEALLADAVTSGGLLFTASPAMKDALDESFKERGVPLFPIGLVVEGEVALEI